MDFAQFIIDLLLFFVYSLALLLIITWLLRFWKLYVNQKYVNNLKWVMLEIKIPRDIDKNPVAMEIALHSFLQTGGVSKAFDREFLGKMPAYFSLEIASLEGIIHFYVRTEQKYRPLIEANFYSQYPGIEITEAEDYTKLIHFEHNTDESSLWGVRYKTGETWNPYPGEQNRKDKDYEMPADFKPLKTYVDYGLDKDPKEEYKNDPITPIIEFLGSMGKGEYAWYQIMIQDSEGVFSGKKFPKTYIDPKTQKRMNLKEMADEYKKNVRKKLKHAKGSTPKDEYGEDKYIPEVKDKEGVVIKEKEKIIIKEDVFETKTEQSLTQEEKDEIDAINLKMSKPLVRAFVRIGYFVKKGTKYNASNIPTTLSVFKHFASRYNSFTLNPTDPYSYPWEDTFKRRKPWRAEEFFNAYVKREGFYPLVEERKTLDKNEDIFFFPYKTNVRSTWRMFYEVLFHPFSKPEATKDVCTLNLEEVATLWHFPGAVAQTPTLPRIDSTKGVAPTNLPM